MDNYGGLQRLLHFTTYSGKMMLVPQGMGEVCELSLLRRARIEGNRFSES
jgi:hypothetical protein